MTGILVVNKPKGYTSHDVVAKVRRSLNMQKVGHTGTLDPLATGVLPILLGNGTKLSQYIINHDKEYIATIKLGVKTDTGDIEGNIIEEKVVNKYSDKQIKEVLDTFKGKQKQIPPMYSAIKVKGKKLYEYARKGENIEIEPRDIEIYSIELIDSTTNIIKIKVNCSKGTYIRVLCEDIAEKLGTIGTMQNLERTKVGDFCLEDAIQIEDIENLELVKQKLITPEKIFKDLKEIELSNKELQQFLNGVKLENKNIDGLYKIYCENKFIGIGKIFENKLKREYVVGGSSDENTYNM
ncbi:MAG: tRNA pseudouridine(55) synthase TruB [Clostridia bacterium]|nr:tRNA pseudouridine(55) synthase TruB [Clostridia bacterium]